MSDTTRKNQGGDLETLTRLESLGESRSGSRGSGLGEKCKTRCIMHGSTPSGPDVLQLHNERMRVVALIAAVSCLVAALVSPFILPDLQRVGERHATLKILVDFFGFLLNLGIYFAFKSGWAGTVVRARILELVFFLENSFLFVSMPMLIMGLKGPFYDAAAIIVLLRAVFVPCNPKMSFGFGLGLWAFYPVTALVGAWFVPQLATDFQDPELWGLFGFGNLNIGLHLAVGLVAVHYFAGLRRQAFDAEMAGNYRLEDRIGEGGMGEVYRARHALLQRPTVIKMLRPELLDSPTALSRFEREVHSASELTHPNTISIYDYGKTDSGRFYYAMEFLEGMDLQDLVEQFGAVAAARVVFILDQALASLGEAHRRGLLHRDIKPSNVFLAERGGDYDFVKVLDFGLVKQIQGAGMESEAGLTADGSITGTPLYMAPEMFYGDRPIDHRSDLYSVGAVGYFLLAGHPVFDSKNPVEALIDHARTQPRSLRALGVELSEKLDAVILAALEKEPDQRYPRAEDFRSALRSTPEWGGWNYEEALSWWKKNAPDKSPCAGRPISTTSGRSAF